MACNWRNECGSMVVEVEDEDETAIPFNRPPTPLGAVRLFRIVGAM